MQLFPDGMSLPYRGGVVVVQPMALRLAAGGLIEEICSGKGVSLGEGSMESRASLQVYVLM